MTPQQKKNRLSWMAVGIVLAVLAIDQIIKICVKTNLCLHESVHVTDWFYISFVENNGMAYGMTIVPKLALSLFRIAAVGLIGWYICRLVKQGARTLYIALMALIMAGAAGNIFDSMFYGLMFSDSTPFQVAQWVPFGEGYGDFLKGRVVDMFYFPIIETDLPGWVPFWGGDHFIFFSPVFNFADAAISTGVVALLLFCRKELASISLFSKREESETNNEDLNN
ncbi:MAG: lipoprotein signal peptidase [Prevotella sp.]|nr:lipoprotein signal peptidase [Prevotella sp.]